MQEKVSADTISALTARSGFSGHPGTPPDAAEMISNIRAALEARAKNLSALVKTPAPPSPFPTPFEISLSRAEEDVRQFEGIVAHVPDGFRLAPVWYSKISGEKNDVVMEEFKRFVRPHFLKYLARHHADELRALGLCAHGIELMMKGEDPKDTEGRAYDVSVDHIVERSGGGTLSLNKAVDRLMPPGSAATYLVNHFDNFILLPGHVHEFKNALNMLQHPFRMATDQGGWVLMLVPETGPGRSGFVAAPQAKGHPLHGLHMTRASLSDKVRHAAGVVERVHSAIGWLGQGDVSEGLLKSALSDAAKQLKNTFNSAASAQRGGKSHGVFLKFYNGESLAQLRRETAGIPFTEAAQLRATLQDIDHGIRTQFKQRGAKPANGNKKPAAKRKAKTARGHARAK